MKINFDENELNKYVTETNKNFIEKLKKDFMNNIADFPLQTPTSPGSPSFISSTKVAQSPENGDGKSFTNELSPPSQVFQGPF